MERYQVQPAQVRQLEIYKFQVTDTLDNSPVAYTVTQEQAANFCRQMNTTGYIWVDG